MELWENVCKKILGDGLMGDDSRRENLEWEESSHLNKAVWLLKSFKINI